MSDRSTDTADANGDDEESVDETLDQLAATVEDTADDESEDDGSPPSDESETESEPDTNDESSAGSEDSVELPGADVDTPEADAEALVTRAVEDIESLLTEFSGEESIEGAKEDVEDLIEVVEEAGELIESVDPAALAGAVDPGELPEAVEIEEVPEAAREGDPGEAVEYRKLLHVIELGDVWKGMDVREVWENKREFEDELDDLTEDGSSSDEGPLATLRDALDLLTRDEDDAASENGFLGDDDADDGGLMGGDSGGNDTDAAAGTDDREDIDVPTEVMQQRIQSGLDDAVEEFREGLLDTKQQLEARKAENAERVEDVEQPASRNPTAHSTLSTAGGSTPDVAKHSTVPMETRYSTAPNRERLYGSRLERSTEDEDE